MAECLDGGTSTRRAHRNFRRRTDHSRGEQPMKDRGMVLITVLWILAVIAFISFALAAAVRTELNAAANSFDSERALFMAKGAAEVLFKKLQNPDTFPELPVREQFGTYTFEFGSGEVRIQPESDRG